MKNNNVAFIYDFDGTLAYGNIQDYNFIPAINMSSKDFWSEVDRMKVEHNMENVLAYMYLMLKKAEASNISVKKSAFLEYGKNVKFYEGVEEWFDRINEYGKRLGLNIHHYIISSGIKEMIEGTTISEKFERIYACSFLYNIDGIAKWPALSVNYTNKTQFLYRINKGILEVYDTSINDKMDKDKRAIPFPNMIYFGDGLTDVPCMKLVKDNGGNSIAVYEKEDKVAAKLIKDGRVNFSAIANYSENSDIDIFVKQVLNNIKDKSDE